MPVRGVKVVLVSAIASGQGKTTVTAALARKLLQQGKRVRVFKTGPDFLDPMMLERASRQPVHSLDLWIVGLERCRMLLAQAAVEADVILIEGVMGLYDGAPSSADLARAFGVPVMLVIDASAMAQTAGAVAMGLRDYGPVTLAGMIANRVASPRHADMVAGAMRDIPLLATLGKQQQTLPERHLGLLPPGEVAQIESLLDSLSSQLEINGAAWEALPELRFDTVPAPDFIDRPLHGKTIAVARDDAFAFMYQANLDCLRDLGATVVFFSPLADEAVPTTANAVYLPGGYPELHAQTLSQAAHWQSSIRNAHQSGKPIVAECGGMMALAETLVDQHGEPWAMSGLLQGQVTMQKRLAALGPQAWDCEHGELRGHAFHYSRFDTQNPPSAYTRKHSNGEPGEPIYRSGSLTATYFHAYFPSCPEMAARLFLGKECG